MSKAVIFTTTFYPNVGASRLQLATKMTRLAIENGFQVLIVDGSPDDAVRDMLSDAGAIVHKQDDGLTMGGSRRQALTEALNIGDRFFIWTEPEKYTMMHILDPVIDELRRSEIVIPRRFSQRSYPKYQQYCELTGNWEFASMTGRNLDIWAGPRGMTTIGAQYFLNYKGCAYDGKKYDDRWDSIFVPVIRAIAAGTSVTSVTIPYIHPPEQTAEEEGNPAMDAKRDDQLASLLAIIKYECEHLGLPRRRN